MNSHDHDPRQQQAWDALGSVEDHPTVEEWLRQIERDGPAARRWGRGAVMAVAASVVVVVTLGFVGYLQFATPHYETQVGEQRDVLLDDGSRITLNTNTLVSVRYSKERRHIELERGEALFVVKHDAARPFDVSAGSTVTRALGTQFNVDLRHSNVTVSVLEGVVRVAAIAAAVAAPAAGPDAQADDELPSMATIRPALSQGEAVEVRPLERRVVAEKADLRRIDAWRTRKLEFSDTPLPEAVEEFNRYSDRRVVVGSPQLESVRLSGVFNIGDEDGFFFSLEQALHVRAIHSAGVITLVMTSPDAAK